MLAIFSNRTYRHLFAAQVIALIGTGLATVALGLLAWQLAEDDAFGPWHGPCAGGFWGRVNDRRPVSSARP